MNLLWVGKRFLLNGTFVKVIGETDTGSVKLENGAWTTYDKLTPIDGATIGFQVLDLPLAA
ncbi:hypothetical protein [Nitrospira sp. BLG_2]|uniref:hypothetical protein n=1 Tax=Nitrospira sp. BLG_2 TaxID=3397507 RepID=UPI003B9D34FF